MRIGVMVGPERGRYATKVERLRRRRWAEEAGLSSVWIPQIPDDFDALTAVAIIGARDRRASRSAPRSCPVQPRHPIALAQQALSVQAVCEGRLLARPRRVAPLDHRRDARPAVRAPGGDDAGLPRRARPGARRARARSTSRTTLFRVHNPLDITDVTPTPVLIAALGPVMLRLAGERTDGTILWMADERAIGVPHRAARSPRPPRRPVGRRPAIVAGIPVCLCGDDEVDVAVARTNRILSEAEMSPNYQRLLDHGDARDVGDILAAGQRVDDREATAVLRRRRRHRRHRCASSPSATTATSCSPRRKRTRDYLASLDGSL